ncbi:MAG: 3-carboxy-cis,cis-muconate cycloisomerase [Pseudomonadota bacterium]
MSFTPYNAPLLSGLLGHMEIAAQFSVKADIEAMLKVETMLAKSQAEAGLIRQEHYEEIERACSEFEPDMVKLQNGVLRDGMAVPEFIRQLRETCKSEAGDALHFGSTSQDVIDTSLIVRLVRVNSILERSLIETLDELSSLESKFGSRTLMARTRMQAALSVSVADRLRLWSEPLANLKSKFVDICEQLHVIQLGGPVGDLNKMGEKGAHVRSLLAKNLDLFDPGSAWHTDRTRLYNYCNWLSDVCGATGKIGQDILLMAQNEVNEIHLKDPGGSSAMAHKKNPVKAEVLITNARFVASLNSGLQHNKVHEQERSGSAWTFEWLMLPQLCVATGASLRNTIAVLKSVIEIAQSETRKPTI